MSGPTVSPPTRPKPAPQPAPTRLAANDPKLTSNVSYPYMGIDIDLGGTGPELVTWVGDLGGGAASVASGRVAAPGLNVSTIFKGPAAAAGAPPYSDYGASINLEGDVAGFVVATGSTTAVTAPALPTGKPLSDALQDYLTPGAAASSAWKDRATTFLSMYGATFDAAGALTNRAVLVSAFAAKTQAFACNYLSSRVKDGHTPLGTAKAAAVHITPAAQEVAETFVDALDDSRKTGARIEAKRFPSPGPAGSAACGTQLGVAGALGTLKSLSPFGGND
jgi:hypothetical protein